jgi:hypothetical protein
MSMNVLNNFLKLKLEAITGISNVYDFAWVDFDGFPAATITPSGFESNYETSEENLRKYVFTVRLFHKIDVITDKTKEKDRVQEAFRIMRILIDTVVDGFDKDETMNGIVLPAGKTMMSLIPVPTNISYFPEEKIIVGEVNLNINISFDTTI